MTDYRIDTYTDRYVIYELTEASTSSSVRICPERGGIAIGCRLRGEELFYLDRGTFLDPQANIRGGNPVLFPISGQLRNGEYEWEGRTYRMRNHGVARVKPWRVTGRSTDGEAALELTLDSDAETLESYPFAFTLRFTYALKDGKLTIRQQYVNRSDRPMPMYPGFHPYFATEDKAIVYETDATRYLDYNDMTEKPVNGAIDLNGLVESVALLDPKTPEIAFPLSSGSRVRMTYSEHFNYVVLWSVQGKPFICVEPWMAMTGELNRGPELVMVAPNSALSAELAIERV
ncbi:aldose epimerase [Paenibacillus thermoaerophilus]|uniref:Aldose epimerase n=1 Tax=Paenibacillus thermoaerophilus TaxID=1215385 RepID=A0ABW2V420_9BACL|nr:aldose epimerase [Paenibacillus thermoaerophilus]TMV13932.1 aldose epimerase [Paenibacillus thermoaerophilus]